MINLLCLIKSIGFPPLAHKFSAAEWNGIGASVAHNLSCILNQIKVVRTSADASVSTSCIACRWIKPVAQSGKARGDRDRDWHSTSMTGRQLLYHSSSDLLARLCLVSRPKNFHPSHRIFDTYMDY